MSPAPSPRHQFISTNIKYELKDGIRKTGCRKCKVYDFIDVFASDDTIVQPDALIVCGDINKPYLDFPAALVVEILSPSTALKDRNNKLYIYQSLKIPYYLIIDPDQQVIEIYVLQPDGHYQSFRPGPEGRFSFLLDDDCQIEVALAQIWE